MISAYSADYLLQVINTSTVLDQIKEIARKHGSRSAAYREEVKKELIGKIVQTEYNKQTYRISGTLRKSHCWLCLTIAIEDVDFDASIHDTFPRRINDKGEVEETSFFAYYSAVRNLKVAK